MYSNSVRTALCPFICRNRQGGVEIGYFSRNNEDLTVFWGFALRRVTAPYVLVVSKGANPKGLATVTRPEAIGGRNDHYN